MRFIWLDFDPKVLICTGYLNTPSAVPIIMSHFQPHIIGIVNEMNYLKVEFYLKNFLQYDNNVQNIYLSPPVMVIIADERGRP